MSSLDKTLKLIKDLKAKISDVVEGEIDSETGEVVQISPNKLGYLLQTLIQVAKFERELEESHKENNSKGTNFFPGIPLE